MRQNKNRSGSVSVQVVSKFRGRYKVLKSIGASNDKNEIKRLIAIANDFIHSPEGQQSLFPYAHATDEVIDKFISTLSNAQIHTIGPELIFGTLFDRIGFNKISDELFRHLVIARIAYPTSKLKTIDYLKRYQGVEKNVDSLYRFLDKLHSRYKDDVEAIAFANTKKILGETISIVFYDMTTLYFEAEDEDDLRKIGFSKDGKFQHPQIMLGLLVGKAGYPISYDIFEGNTFEGHTLLPVLQRIEKKYGFKDTTLIADAAMLSKNNLKKLNEAKCRFIVGGRIKNESDAIREQILQNIKSLHDGNSLDLTREDGTRLIITYSTQRAKKDSHNRNRGLSKLKQRISRGKLTKEHLNNRGYNRFLILEGTMAVSLDENKITADAQWDGLKGYVTNTEHKSELIVENYRELWQIEKAFRISKTDLRIRPIYHFRKKRIEAHICIAFAAYTIIKELERLLQEAKIVMSPKRAAELTRNMYQITYTLPHSKKNLTRVLEMDDEQKILTNLIR